MTQEDKKLLLIDLCARLPYGVKYMRHSWNYEWDQEMSVVEILEDIDKEGYINYHKVYKVSDIKPYLRPMSSMTDEEKEAFQKNSDILWCRVFKPIGGDPGAGTEFAEIADIDWLNAHHFDYRGLIDKGLALKAPEGMYKTV